MDIFEEAKRKVDILDVCELLGIKLNRNHTAICPFHKEKTPSFSVSPSKQIYKCFGCGKGGDTISLVAEMLKMSQLNAVKYLNEHFGLGIKLYNDKELSYSEKKKNNAIINKYNQRKRQEEFFLKKENITFQTLCDYLHFLERRYEEEKSRITSIDDFFDNEYISKYLQERDKINYYIDFFIYGTNEDKIWFLNTNGKVVKEYGKILGR